MASFINVVILIFFWSNIYLCHCYTSSSITSTSIVVGSTSHKPTEPVSSEPYPDVYHPTSTFQTALNQVFRLVQKHDRYKMTRLERVLRISLGWLSLFIAKFIALGSPLYFKRLITLSTSVNEVDLGNKAIQSIATGFIIGYGMSKIASGFIQLISDNILYPATLEAAELLPSEAFNAALREASMRSDDYYENLKNKNKKESAAAVESGGEGQTGFARRALDRGLKASNQFLYRTIFNLFPSIVEAFCVVILIYNKTGPKVGLVSAIVGSIFVVVTAKVMHARIPIQRNMLKAEGVANGCADDALALAETVAAFGSEVLETERYSKALSGVSDASIRVRRSFSLLKLLQSTILGFGAAAVAFTAWHSNIGKTSDFTGQLILVQALFAQLCAPLDHIGQHFRDCVVAAEDLRDLENLKKKLDHLSLPQQSNSMPSSLRSDNSLNLTSSFYTTNPNVLEIKNLNFYYPGVSLLRGNLTQLREKAILKNISISIPSGGYAIGIVGPSGSGKSTLIRVLAGIENIHSYDEFYSNYVMAKISEAKEVNFTHGHTTKFKFQYGLRAFGLGNIKLYDQDITLFNRTSYFSLVNQENDLFRSLTLAENVRYGCHGLGLNVPDIESEESNFALIKAATDAQLYPVINRLPDGWEAPVGPRGRFLSGGERQRTCLARALYREQLSKTILIADEVTSGLDAKTESLVSKAIFDRVKRGSTAILIAHRLSSVQMCNKIYVLKDGEIIEEGSHDELVNQGGWYAEAWALQSQKQNKETNNLI